MRSDARILVVDDEPKICSMLTTVLERQGYDVQACLDAPTALERFQAAAFDVVISDLRMPGVNGFELIRQIKRSRPATVVVAVTGHATPDTAVQALQCGADDYITKPFDIGNVRRVLESSLRNRDLLEQARSRAAEPSEAAPPEAPRPSPAQDLIEANRGLEQRVADLVAVQEAAQAVAGQLRLEALVDTAVESVGTLVRARTVSILLPEPSQECVVVRARRGHDRRHVVGERRSLGEGIAGWVAQHRVPLLIPAVEEQPAFRAMARGEGYETGSFVAVPLLCRDCLLGVVCCAEKADGEPFVERDLRMLVGLAPQLAIAIENAHFHEALRHNAFATLCTLADNLEVRDGYLRGHAARVADYATRTARELGLSSEAIHALGQAARIHDIGKIAVSDTVLGRTGPLTDEEHAVVREHPLRGERIIQALGFLDSVRPIVRHHHERWDGKGYPDGLAGRGIDRLTRILTIADAFDAITSPRPHRPARSHEGAFVELAGHAGAQFDPNLLEPFRRAVAGIA